MHWQVTRIIPIMTVPKKSVFRADDDCVKFAVNRTPFLRPRPSSKEGGCLQGAGLCKGLAQHAIVAFKVPILIQCRPVHIQVFRYEGPGETIRVAACWSEDRRFFYRPFWKFSKRSPTHELETKLSGSITRRPRRAPPADRPLGTPHLFSELRRRLFRTSSLSITHSGRGRQGGRNHGGFDCRNRSPLQQALGHQRQNDGEGAG